MRICRRSLSGIDLAILARLDDGPFEGLQRMAATLYCNDRRHVRRRLRKLQSLGMVVLDYPPTPSCGHQVVIKRRK